MKTDTPIRTTKRTPTTMPSRAITNFQPATLPSPEAIRSMVAEAAYYKAIQRGFAPGLEQQDWLEAERQVLAKFQLNQPL